MSNHNFFFPTDRTNQFVAFLLEGKRPLQFCYKKWIVFIWGWSAQIQFSLDKSLLLMLNNKRGNLCFALFSKFSFLFSTWQEEEKEDTLSLWTLRRQSGLAVSTVLLAAWHLLPGIWNEPCSSIVDFGLEPGILDSVDLWLKREIGLACHHQRMNQCDGEMRWGSEMEL